MEIETTQIKTKDHHIWGWLSAIAGGSLILLCLFLTIEEIFSSPTDWYQIFLSYYLPACLLAVPLLIYGIRRIKSVHANERIDESKIDIELVDAQSTDVEPAVVGSADVEQVDLGTLTRKNDKQQVLSWVSAIVGGGFIYFGYLILMMEIFTADSTNWFIYLILSVLSFLFGIPLLIMGIRRIKNFRVKDELMLEKKTKKHRGELFFGWLVAIAGGLFTLFGVDFMYFSIFGASADGDSEVLVCAVPGLIFGIFLLFIGIRRIKSVGESVMMNPENITGKEKRRHIWGIILVIIGVLTILIGFGFLSFFYYALIILSPQKGIAELYSGYNTESLISLFFLYCLPLILLGLFLLIRGFVMLRKKQISRQSHGWLLNVMGGVYLIVSILSIFYTEMMNFNNESHGTSILFWSPILLLGILAITFGIRDITYVENFPPEYPENLDQLHSEVEPG
jgi:hypothetical protein